MYGINLDFFSRWRPRKKSRFAGPGIFLRFEADLDFQKSRCRLKGRMTKKTGDKVGSLIICIIIILFLAV